MAAIREAFIGIDAAKLRNAVAIADAGRDGEVRYFGEVDASLESMRRLIGKLASKYEQLHFCYEAGPTGYGLHRLITELGHPCTVVAPSLIPRKPSDRVKTNRRDAISLARLLRAGELTAVWVPDPAHEGMRNLIRSRTSLTGNSPYKAFPLRAFQIAVQVLPISGPLTPNRPTSIVPIFRIWRWHVRAVCGATGGGSPF